MDTKNLYIHMRESYFLCEVSSLLYLKTSGISGTSGIHPLVKTLGRTTTRVVMVQMALAHVYIEIFGVDLTDAKDRMNKTELVEVKNGSNKITCAISSFGVRGLMRRQLGIEISDGKGSPAIACQTHAASEYGAWGQPEGQDVPNRIW